MDVSQNPKRLWKVLQHMAGDDEVLALVAQDRQPLNAQITDDVRLQEVGTS